MKPHSERDTLVGRDAELAEIVAAVGENRLVTIVGPPGVGKTRLAAEAGAAVEEEFEVATVDLTSVSSSGYVARAVATALGVANAGSSTAVEAAVMLVGERRVLLSLDNCEHVLKAVVDVVGVLIDACPNLCVLATSREALGLGAELVWVLSPLEQPDAVALFVARAGRRFVLDATNADAVGEICRRLDGLPLAIELAATRSDVLAPHQLLTMMDERRSTVVADPGQADPRHRTLDAAIAWSWHLLTPTDQALIRRLSVFSGGATATAIRNVCAGTEVITDEVDAQLARLVSHSLVARGNNRYRLLETVRHFVRDQLATAGESDEARNRHAAWGTTLAEAGERHLTGPQQREWIKRLNGEAENLRAAMEWLITDHQVERALRLTSSLTLWWRATSALAEGRRWLGAALSNVDGAPTIGEGKAFFGAALLADVQGDPATAWSHAVQSLQIGGRLNDRSLRARSLLLIGRNLLCRGESGEAASALQECVALAREAHDAWCLSYGLTILAGASGGRAALEEAIRVARDSGDAIALAYGLVSLAGDTEDPKSAQKFLSEAMSATSGIGCPEHTSALTAMGRLALAQRDLASAESYLGCAREEALRADSLDARAATAYELANVARADGDVPEARAMLDHAMTAEDHANVVSIPVGLLQARMAAASGDYRAAADGVRRFEEFARTKGLGVQLARALLVRADIFRRASRDEDAQDALTEALSLFESTGDTAGLADCLDDLGGLAITRGLSARGVTLLAAAESLRATEGIVHFLPDHPHYETDLSTARAQLFPDDFERAWCTGEGATLEDALRTARNPVASLVEVREEVWAQLTEKERAVVELVGSGLTNREIAERLFISIDRVKARLRHARRKIGSSSRSSLVGEVQQRRR
ncbi:MAG: LuxR C-terminal-related transcriptional regulator [Actinomycetota bacterium]|nr:LuxR C-terminal-related transcriptional regulator [Actinomycetota bacterium]